jgi:TonB family protein
MLLKTNISKEAWIKSLVIMPLMGLMFYTFSCSPDYMKQDVQPLEEVAMSQEQADQKKAALSNELESIYKKHPDSKMAIDIRKEDAGKKSIHFSTANISSEKDKARIVKISEEMTSLMNLFPGEASSAQANSSSDDTFMVVEDQPKPAGGMEAIQEYMAANLKYPAEAKAAGKEGRVFVEFVVDKDGSITDTKVLKGISDECNAEALRVISNMPAWQPGKQSGVPVRVKMVMPVAFKLD